MAFFFGDSFDPYAAIGDLVLGGHWDAGGAPGWTLTAGRFGGQALSLSFNAQSMFKTSGVNDAVHHFFMSFFQNTGTGNSPLMFINLDDGGSIQCSIVFYNSGNIVLTSGDWNGAALTTYASAVVPSVWYGLEIEVVINNTTGSFRVRKNGNTVDDFAATSLNTRAGSSNNYANKIRIGTPSSNFGEIIDDFLWRSDASSVPWAGNLRCFTRRPASDQSVAWTRNAGTTNFGRVSESLQDGASTYVSSSTIGQGDLYGLSSASAGNIIGVVTRALAQVDSGARSIAVQTKSGSTTSSGTAKALTAGAWSWVGKTDLVDPNTGAAWTPTAVDTLQIGQTVTA